MNENCLLLPIILRLKSLRNKLFAHYLKAVSLTWQTYFCSIAGGFCHLGWIILSGVIICKVFIKHLILIKKDGYNITYSLNFIYNRT